MFFTAETRRKTEGGNRRKNRGRPGKTRDRWGGEPKAESRGRGAGGERGEKRGRRGPRRFYCLVGQRNSKSKPEGTETTEDTEAQKTQAPVSAAEFSYKVRSMGAVSGELGMRRGRLRSEEKLLLAGARLPGRPRMLRQGGGISFS
jgi:hypothetical protein